MTRRGRLLGIAALAAATCVCGCSQAPQIDPSMRLWDDSIAWMESPTILLGTVVLGRIVRTGVELKEPWPLRVELHELAVKPERYLRGDGPRDGVKIYRFSIESGHLPGSVPMAFINPGERRIFFLQKENGVLRTCVDVVSSSFVVMSGEHNVEVPSQPRNIKAEIAEILLSPGANFDEEQYVNNALHGYAVGVVPRMIGRRGTIGLLRRIQALDNRRVSVEACMVSYILSWIGDNCASRLLGDASLPGVLRTRLEDAVSADGDRVRRELDLIRSNPEAWYREHSREGMYDPLDASLRFDDIRFFLEELEKLDDRAIALNVRKLRQRHSAELGQ